MPGTRGPVPIPLRDGHRDITLELLEMLDTKSSFDTHDTFPDIGQGEIKAALDRLASRSMVQYSTTDTEQVVLTAEGQTICDEGSHEYKVWKAVKDAGKLELKDLPVSQSFIQQFL